MSQKTVLVIDDDVKFSFGLVAVLKRDGFRVLSAGNGTEGLSMIRAENPDIILCDIMMPPPNGLQLKKELSGDPVMGKIPFIFLSARTAPVDKRFGLEIGADDYITKPFDVGEMLARIQSVLRRDEIGHDRGVKETHVALDKLRSSISANLSHEMRTPLTVLLATLDLVLEEKFTDDQAELNHYLTRATNSAQRLMFLTEDLELLYDIDNGQLCVRRQAVDLRFHFAIPVERITKVWEEKKLSIQLKIEPDVVVHAPKNEFGHVVAHLVDNACKFSPQHGRVTLWLRANGVGGCILDVSDEGRGIPAQYREQVFERYFQISQGDAREYGGLGVGLSVARTFARALGGDVQILESSQGCRVRLVLPPHGLGN